MTTIANPGRGRSLPEFGGFSFTFVGLELRRVFRNRRTVIFTLARLLADAVRRVHQGLRVVDPALAADSLAYGDSPLTERETDVLVAAREGGTVSDIARHLHLSEGTVRNHLSAAIGKTGARTRAEAVRRADEYGWLLV